MHKEKKFTGTEHWNNIQDIAAESYRCGYCSADSGSGYGWQTDGKSCFIRVCPQCNAPTFFAHDRAQWPGPKVGSPVDKLPPDVDAMYGEARSSIAANANTGAVMLCRKILMHIAVEKGAKENRTFKQYVEWLINEHYVPRGAEGWLGYIRERGNEANHEIVSMNKDDALGVLRFTEMLLRGVYELPALVPAIPAVPPDAEDEADEG